MIFSKSIKKEAECIKIEMSKNETLNRFQNIPFDIQHFYFNEVFTG